MAYIRAFVLGLTALAFYVLGSPVQWLALSRGWPLSRWIPGFFHRTICRILRINVQFVGQFAPVSPLLIVSNHLSWVDIMTLSTGEPVCFLSKREVKSWPIFGTFAVLQRSVFVARDRLADLPRVNVEIAARLLGGDRIVLFAESTTTDGASLLRFRATHFGAAQALLAQAPDVTHVAIQPVAVTYVSRDGHTEVAWYGDMDMLPHLWLLLKGGPYDCTIHVGEPILFDRATDRKAATRATEAAVAGLLAAAGRLSPAASTPAQPAGILFNGEKP
ncbi:MAG: 1-acyl-sn-glycerol-3-phosphate acyltransferase [Methylobacteriaceae bacterium]|nr:1-acyl-sn-glycerol-3-phosphate acyltransferase [Methylobacteriaceae bacterium]